MMFALTVPAFSSAELKIAMPTYEYRCKSCGNDFEKFQRMSEPAEAGCPACGSPAERRLSGGAGLLFKGSGFYITDYRSEGYKKAEKEDKLEPWKKPGAIPESKGKGADSASSGSEGKTTESKTTEAKPTPKSDKNE